MSIPPVGVHPDHLVNISDQHKGPFDAIETLLAYICEARVTEINIDTKVIDTERCLVFSYNGVGMDKCQLHKMFSLGYCKKIEKMAHPTTGHIGVGCMSGSLRLGKDMTVFTRNKNTAAIGFLSLTYLDAVKSDFVVVPSLEYSIPDFQLIPSMESSFCLKAILDHSIFPNETRLLDELKELKKSGTKIIISNLRKADSIQGGVLELDFDFSMKDIIWRRALGNNGSLKEFLESEHFVHLNHKPNLKITLRHEHISLVNQKRTSVVPPDAPTETEKSKVFLPDHKQSTSLTTPTLKLPKPMQVPTVNSSQSVASSPVRVKGLSNPPVQTPSTSNAFKPSVDLNRWFSSLPLFEKVRIMNQQHRTGNVNIEFNLKNN